MTTALAERPTQAVAAPTVTAEQLDLIRRTIAKDATPDELKLYLYDCARQGVHPLDKLIHFTKRSGKYTPITSIDFMRIRAAETNEYAGSDDAVFVYDHDGKGIEQATVTVWRFVQGQRCAFTATARWSEYKPESNDFMWRKMPHTMLGKCAEALALRKGFPRQLAGLYAKEEMDQADSGVPVASSTGRLTVEKDVHVAGNAHEKEPTAVYVDAAVVDQETGEVLPEPPPGYHYLTDYHVNGIWHEAQLLKYQANGGAIKISTKRPAIQALMAKAANEGIPVKPDVTIKKDYPDEAYVNNLELYHPPPTDAEIDAEIAARDRAQKAGEIA